MTKIGLGHIMRQMGQGVHAFFFFKCELLSKTNNVYSAIKIGKKS